MVGAAFLSEEARSESAPRRESQTIRPGRPLSEIYLGLRHGFKPRTIAMIAGALLLGYWALLACVPFWLPYQNFWLAMGEGLTSSQAFSARQRLLLATTYAICVLAALAISTIYWKVAGIL